MRHFKKLIRKLYHLIWFLSLFFLFCSPVKATVMIDGAEFTQSSFVAFADNTNGQLTRIWTTFVDNGSYYRSTSAIMTNGSNSYGANWAFYSDIPFIEGHTYALSVLIGMANTYAITNSTSNSRLCIAENLTNVFTRYNNYNFPCTTAWAISTNGVSSFSDGNITYDYTLLSYVFTAEFTSNAITGSYNSALPNESNHVFGGYIVQEVGGPSLSSQQVQSIVQNSGLATASSVANVQSSVNGIRNDLQALEEQERQNAQDIIDNQNSNTNSINQNIDEQFNDCSVRDMTLSFNNAPIKGSGLNSSGSVVSNSNYNISNYVGIKPNTSIKIWPTSAIWNNLGACFYTKEKTLISCETYGGSNYKNWTSPNNAYFFRATLSGDTKINSNICFNRIDNLTDSITDSSIDSSDGTINSLKGNLPTNSVISDLLLLPIRLLQAIVNSLGGTCSSFNLGSLYGTNLIMPCIDLESYLGSAIWTFIDLVFSGMFILVIRKKFIQIWENITNLKGGANEVD